MPAPLPVHIWRRGAYEEVVKLVDAKLGESYPGQSGDQRQLMKCIDLYWGPNLQRVVARYAKPKRARP